MSKYIEAIEFLEHLEGKDLEFSWTDSGITELLKARDLAVETLEIADRLEQIIIEEQTADCIIVDVGCVNNEHDKEVWLNGYNQALSDVRGDEE